MLDEHGFRRTCSDCGVVNCRSMDKSFPNFCVSDSVDEELLDFVLEQYQDETNHRIAVTAAEIESDYYCMKTRVEEVVLFARRMHAKKIGIATCVGLIRETNIFAKILRENGFEVYGVSCKVGIIPKVEIGIPERCMEVGINMCNPILQAMILNREKTDINVVIGLCVGHDSLFYKYSEAITTTLVTKDRVLVHNPCAALYASEQGYYAKKLHDPNQAEKMLQNALDSMQNEVGDI